MTNAIKADDDLIAPLLSSSFAWLDMKSVNKPISRGNSALTDPENKKTGIPTATSNNPMQIENFFINVKI